MESQSQTPYFVGIQVNHLPRLQYFSTTSSTYQPNDTVIVETGKGYELGIIKTKLRAMSDYRYPFQLMPIVRKAENRDLAAQQRNEKDSKEAMLFAKDLVKKMNLEMEIFAAEYNLDRSKLYFLFLSEDRVDFRDLLRALATQFHTRIDLRQVGARDRAKLYGAIGICGLPLCCTTFLNEFDNISINRAKNQMLTLNIPKLTGHCGKLLCCLKYEDDTYTEIKATLPHVGDRYMIEGVSFKVTSMNVLTRVIKVENQNRDIQFLHVDELNKHPKGTTMS
ncbi:MAG: stage 0 sporulation protein [Firmicutes bacterium]|nr:stage 0 sporulation protein [Bacillota bacterium]